MKSVQRRQVPGVLLNTLSQLGTAIIVAWAAKDFGLESSTYAFWENMFFGVGGIHEAKYATLEGRGKQHLIRQLQPVSREPCDSSG